MSKIKRIIGTTAVTTMLVLPLSASAAHASSYDNYGGGGKQASTSCNARQGGTLIGVNANVCNNLNNVSILSDLLAIVHL